jgi:hypothetical protein
VSTIARPTAALVLGIWVRIPTGKVWRAHGPALLGGFINPVNRHVGIVIRITADRAEYDRRRFLEAKSAGPIWKSAPLANGPQGAALASTFRPVPFSLKPAPGVPIEASRDGLHTNLGPRARRVYVGQQFANFAIPAAPLTLYVPTRARREHLSYLAPQLPPAADKAQQAGRLPSLSRAFASCTIRTIPQSGGGSFHTRPARTTPPY